MKTKIRSKDFGVRKYRENKKQRKFTQRQATGSFISLQEIRKKFLGLTTIGNNCKENMLYFVSSAVCQNRESE